VREVAHARKRNPLSDLNKILYGGRYPRLITYANFGDDRLRGLGVAGGQNLPFSIDFDRRPYNTLALPCECVITFSLSVEEMHLYAFISTLVPKLVAVVTPFVPCVRECHR